MALNIPTPSNSTINPSKPVTTLTQPNPATAGTNEDKQQSDDSSVQISDLAQSKLKTEQQKSAASSSEGKGDPIDEAIKKVQEQIKHVQQELDELRGNETEAALQMKQQLHTQLVALYGQLMSLFEQKLEQLKQNKK